MLESDRGGVVPIRGLKRNERTDDLTRSSERNKGICLTRSLTKNKTFCNGDDTTGLLISGDLYADSKQGVWSDLSEEVASKLSKSVVSLSLVDGQSVLFACSGIVVRRVKHVTRFLTSANFVEALNERRKDHDNLKIQVRHGDNVEIGVLGEYDLDHNIANVHAMNIPDLQPVVFNNLMELPPLTEVASVGMDISGKLMGTSGILNDNPSGSEYSGKLTLSKFSKVCDGGPLFGFDGMFVGMNLILAQRDACSCNRCRFGDLKSLRYPPLPKSRSNGCMILVNNFEDHFGDEHGKGVWSELSETVSSNIYENIVALASFNGKKRFFACTGFFIKWNGGAIILTSASLIRRSHDLYKIVENLRIEVLRPNGQHAEGELQHYNLHYNVALVSVKDFCPREPATIQHMWHKNCELLAVGFCFKSSTLMASRGHLFVGPSIFDCKFLGYSRCTITKAGIGGPLLRFDGKFVGMNFFDEVTGTPYLCWSEILPVLDNFKTKRTVAEGGYDKRSRVLEWSIDGDSSTCPNCWPVPKPFWCHPDNLDKHKTEILRSRPLRVLL